MACVLYISCASARTLRTLYAYLNQKVAVEFNSKSLNLLCKLSVVFIFYWLAGRTQARPSASTVLTGHTLYFCKSPRVQQVKCHCMAQISFLYLPVSGVRGASKKTGAACFRKKSTRSMGALRDKNIFLFFSTAGSVGKHARNQTKIFLIKGSS